MAGLQNPVSAGLQNPISGGIKSPVTPGRLKNPITRNGHKGNAPWLKVRRRSRKQEFRGIR